MISGKGYPRVSFGIIVLNGEPFTRFCLRSLYPFAHQIIVVEGAHEEAGSVATEDGHSVDGTLEELYRFQREEDPLGKVEIVTRDGFWPMRDELGRCKTVQSRAYADRATGDYLWQVDIDEFYLARDMERVLAVLTDDPTITAVSFHQRAFWGRPAYEVDGWPLRRGKRVYHRLFKWGPGYRYVTHQQPTVADEQGRDLRQLHWLRPGSPQLDGVYLYHYSLLFPWQVEQKSIIYEHQNPEGCADIVEWAREAYFKLGRPYRMHNLYKSPGWLQRYHGSHPSEVESMMAYAAAHDIRGGLRPIDDVDAMIDSWWYPVGRNALKVLDYVDRLVRWTLLQALRASHAPRKVARAIRRATSGRGGGEGSRPGVETKRPGGVP